MPTPCSLRTCFFVCAGLCLAFCAQLDAVAQPRTYDVYYQPRLGERYVLATRHFDIIHAAEDNLAARHLARSLELAYVPTMRRIGVARTFRLPVVLNSANDASNAFVATRNFRSEINVQPIRSTDFPLRQASWFDIVGAHELTHAVHAQFGSGFGLVGLLRLFSPDLARATNLALPQGVTEGIAVIAESPRDSTGGRLQHSLFRARFRSVMASRKPWGMSRALTRSRFVRPFGQRGYLGGSHFLVYAQNQIDEDYFRKTARVHYLFPFLGYSLSSWIATGVSPGRQSDGFRKFYHAKEDSIRSSLGEATVVVPLLSRRGSNHARPQWIDSDNLIVYRRGYTQRPGLHRVSIHTGETSHIGSLRPTNEFAFFFDRQSDRIFYSRYVTGRLTSQRASADVYSISIRGRERQRVTANQNLTAPFPGPSGALWAVQLSGSYSNLVEVLSDGSVRVIAEFPETQIVQIEVGADGTVYALVNRRGQQGLHTLDGDMLEPLLVASSGGIFDFDLNQRGTKLLFSSDISGISNLYVYDLKTSEVKQLTNVLYGLLHATMSPSDRHIAAVSIRHDRDDLVVLPSADLFTAAEKREDVRFRFRHGRPILAGKNRPSQDDLYADVRTRRYRPARYLRPKTWRPVVVNDNISGLGDEDVDLGIGYGVNVSGADPLRQVSFEVEAFRQANKSWGLVTLQSGQFPFRPYVNLYRTPDSRVITTTDSSNVSTRVGLDEKGVTFGGILPVNLANNVYQSAMVVGLEASRYSQRLFDNDVFISDYRTRSVIEPFFALHLFHQTNTRDLRQNTGFSLFSSALRDVAVPTGSVTRFGVRNTVRIDLPVLTRLNGSVRLRGIHIYQNRSSIFNLDSELPRGIETTFVPAGSRLGASAEAMLPVLFPDRGSIAIPVFLDAVYIYGFYDWFEVSSDSQVSSSGFGIGTRIRLYYNLAFDLRIGAAYDFDKSEWGVIYR